MHSAAIYTAIPPPFCFNVGHLLSQISSCYFINDPEIDMTNYFRFPLTQLLVLLLFYADAIVAEDLARPQLSAKINKHSPSYDPQPQEFPNEQLYSNYLVIQRFKKTITSDPKNITATWTGHDICGNTTYLGFYCAELPGRTKKPTVTVVIFNGYGLRAPTLKGFINQLPDLAVFHAASNNFGGDIPYLAGLAYNYKFNIVDNNLQTQGAKPDTVGTRITSGVHTGCINFDLDITIHVRPGNGKKGAKIPGFTDSKALLLNHNNLSGPLPANLGFSKLSYLALANNKLTGPIPPSIAQAQDTLLEVLLLNNQLSGCLPHELGMLAKAAVIDAGMNQLTGPIPSSFACLSSVEQLNMGGNRLYGEIPDELCKLAAGPAGRLANLTLSSNYFTSVGPACAALIKDGVLDVKNNCIPGFVNQRQPVECASFLSQLKTCPAASTTHVSCPDADAKNVVAPEGRVARDYSSFVTYATLHE